MYSWNFSKRNLEKFSVLTTFKRMKKKKIAKRIKSAWLLWNTQDNSRIKYFYSSQSSIVWENLHLGCKLGDKVLFKKNNK